MSQSNKKIQQQTQKSKYLQGLLNKHQTTAYKTAQFLQGSNQAYQNKIMDGKYQIRKGSTVKSSRERSEQNSSNRISMHNIVAMKKQLQNKLQIIQENLSGLKNPSSFNNQKMTEQQRQKFIKKMERQRKQAQKKRIQHLKQAQQKVLQAQKKHKQQLQKQENQKKQKRKKQLQRNVQQMNQARKKRQEEIKTQNQLFVQKAKEKVLFDKMLQKYRQAQVTNLQQRKKKLAQIRSLHRPLTKQDFNEHLNKIETLKNQRNKSQADRLIAGNKISQFYKSSWYQKVSHQPRKSLQEKAHQQLQILKEMRQKSVRYGQNVRQNHKPPIDSVKASQFKAKIQKDSSVQSLKYQETRQIGLKYLKMSKQMIDRQAKQKTSSDNQNSRAKPINYLQQLKQNKKQPKVSSTHEYVENIKKKDSLSKVQKAKKIMQYAQKLQNKARMKQQLDKVNKNMIDQDLDQLYMQAIQAKLSLLDKN